MPIAKVNRERIKETAEMQTEGGESLIRHQAYVTSMLVGVRRGHKQLLETGLNQMTILGSKYCKTYADFL